MPQRAVPVPFPAPSGGLNTRDGLELLKANEARELENWIPLGNAVEVRKGQTSWSTGGVAANPVETLTVFNGLTANKLVGIGGGDAYDFSGASASLIDNSNYTDSRFQTECYNNRLIGVNGTDTPWTYDGTTWGATGLSGSGLTIANLINIAKVRTRLWFVEKNSADAWYGGIGSITGVLTKFQLSQVVGGGTLMAIGAHSQDAGSGPDDFTAFIMSTGEVVLYSGDPASTFSKVGNYSMPPPIGRKCLVQIGGQLAVVTHMGLIPLASAISGTAFDLLALGAFGKVSPSIQKDADLYADLEGWEAHFFDGLVIVNVPTLANAASRQWVFNALTGAWTRFTGVNAASLRVWNGNLYFGAWNAGTVYKYTGTQDAGAAIPLLARTAFIAPNQSSRAMATAIRFDMQIDGTISAKFGLDTDGLRRAITIPPLVIGSASASTAWGSLWGSQWSAVSQYEGGWFSTFAEGTTIGIALEATSIATTLQWFGSRVLVQPGGIL